MCYYIASGERDGKVYYIIPIQSFTMRERSLDEGKSHTPRLLAHKL